PKTKPSSSKRPIIREEDETVGEIRSESVTESLEAEYAVSSSSSSREEAVSSSAAESLAPITYTVYCSVTEPDSKTHINAAKTRKIVSDDLTYIFSEIEKGKYDQVSFRGNDLSKLNFKANDKRFRDRVKKDVSSNGELLTYLIAENETVKRFDFGGTGVTGKFCASLESNIKRKSSEKPLSKFVLKRIEFGEDDATGGPKLLNGERGAINDARKAREEFAGQLDLIKQLAKDIEKEKNIYSIEQSLEGISSVALNTPMKIGKYENITLLHYLAYESGTNVFRNSRHLYMKEVAEKLLNAGISPIVKDGQGRTAHELAVNIGNQRHFLVGYIYQNMDLIDYLFAPTQKAFESPFYCDSIDLIRNGRVNDIDWTFEDLKEKDRTMKGTKKKDCEGYFKKVLNQAIDDVPVRNTSSKYYVNGIGLVKNTAIPEPVQKTSLLEYAIRPESYPDSARFHANSAKIAERLIKNAGYSGKTSNGSTLLYALSQTEQDADLIKILIEKDPFPGSTLQEKNKNGKGPLQLAAERKGNSEVLKVLLETGKCTDDDKQAALANAVDSKYASVLNTYTAAGNNKRSVIQKRDTFAKMVTESKTGLSHSKE
ncbi:MAG: hypothetical protein K0R98_1923, partial [Rickettsiaceae bacterium]|nr:hypothetical protein [Rickettsiaceae bacterium]